MDPQPPGNHLRTPADLLATPGLVRTATLQCALRHFKTLDSNSELGAQIKKIQEHKYV